MEIFNWIVSGFWHFVGFLILIDIVTKNLAKVAIKIIDARVEKKFYCQGCKMKERQ